VTERGGREREIKSGEKRKKVKTRAIPSSGDDMLLMSHSIDIYIHFSKARKTFVPLVM
jgi:hypothetical protein